MLQLIFDADSILVSKRYLKWGLGMRPQRGLGRCPKVLIF
jgi:hypothetical protein